MNIVVSSALSAALVYHAQFNMMHNVETCAVLAERNMSILLTTLRRYATVASFGTFCFSPMVHGIT